MVNSLVERATSDMLIGPDWAMNIEICDVLNHDTAQAKGIVKGIKKRIGSRNPKVQLLALTLLETIIKNCGDIVQMHVAEKDVLHEMVKIIKKKPDLHVKEKILILLDTWQEAFGGPGARYPQYYAAYQELLHAGAVFPHRTERAAPVFTPPQTQPLSSYPQNSLKAVVHHETPYSESTFPTLSLSEIQNARGIMDILTEMLSAIDPENKEGLRQEVIVDLVEQCRTYKQRVIHLVNSTSDESLLSQGLALNDDLQRVLAKHESISSGTPGLVIKPKHESSGLLVHVDGPLVDTGDSRKQSDRRFTSRDGADALYQSAFLAPLTNCTAPTATVAPKIDLLSGDDFSSPKAEASLALVPMGGQQPGTPVSQQNALVPFEMYSDNNITATFVGTQSGNPQEKTYYLTPGDQQNFASSQGDVYPYGMVQNMGASHFDQSLNRQGNQGNGAFPPPPWETQSTADGSPVGSGQYPQLSQVSQVIVAHSQGGSPPPGPQQMGNDQIVGMYIQPISGKHVSAINSLVSPSNQFCFHAQPDHGRQHMGMQPHSIQAGQLISAGYGGYGQEMICYGGRCQPQQGPHLEQRMDSLCITENGMQNSYQASTSSYFPPSKPFKPEDKLFDDLVDIAKFKSSTKPAPSRSGSM